MTSPTPPTDGQTHLIECDDPLILATGGPGSGKTRAALLLAKRLLEAEPTDSARNVLFLTFSRSATGELISRTPTLLPKALRHRLEISTFHSYARTIIESFGRYSGRGTTPLSIASRSEEKLNLAPPGSVTFDHLVPAAVTVLNSNAWARARLSSRLLAVICDEYQDTGSAQHDLLVLLSAQSRLICLADPDQMIYDFIPGVSAKTLADLRTNSPTEIALEDRSYRDPTGLIPRVARAIRDRRFTDPALAEARAEGRLRVLTNTNPLFAGVVQEVRTLRLAGHNSVGVFVTQRVMVEELGRDLGDAKIEHEIAGLDGAAGEAEVVIGAMARYATGQGTWDEVCERMAVFLTSAQPQHNAPLIAQMLAGARASLPSRLRARLTTLQDELDNLPGHPISELLTLAESFKRSFDWGDRLWRAGSRDLAAQIANIIREPLDEQTAITIDAIARRRVVDSHVDDLGTPRLPVRLMTTHQAKGREMDAIILVHHPKDIIKPNELAKIQRVHFVAVSRARRTVSIVLPPIVDPFLAPYRTLGR